MISMKLLIKVTTHSHERETFLPKNSSILYSKKRVYPLPLLLFTACKSYECMCKYSLGEYCKVLRPDGGKGSQETLPFKAQNLFL